MKNDYKSRYFWNATARKVNLDDDRQDDRADRS